VSVNVSVLSFFVAASIPPFPPLFQIQNTLRTASRSVLCEQDKSENPDTANRILKFNTTLDLIHIRNLFLHPNVRCSHLHHNPLSSFTIGIPAYSLCRIALA